MCGCWSDSDVAVAEGLYGGVWRDAVKLGNGIGLFVKETASPTSSQLRSRARTDVISVGTRMF
jgi:hypothetical protein